ncbi:MAG: hypothetical protein ABFS02_08785 [Pseudomonadota bacterium]
MTDPKISDKKPISLLLVGFFCSLGPVWGTLGGIIGLVGAFNSDHPLRKGNDEAMDMDINVSLWTTVVGWLMTPIGIILILVSCIWLMRNRRRRDYGGFKQPSQ